jgi:hypothetical protein
VRLLESPTLSIQHKYLLNATANNRFDSATFKGTSLASQWLFVLPNTGLGQTMTPELYRTALQFRLLIQLFPNSCLCPTDRCGQIRDMYGYHLLSCKGTGNTNTFRHDNVAKSLCKLANTVGVSAQFNPKLHLLGTDRRGHIHSFRPADILLSNLSSSATCVDVTVVSPLSAAKEDTSDILIPGSLTIKAVNIKNNNYHSVC